MISAPVERREVDVVLGDPADALVDDVHAHLGVLDLLQLGDGRLDRADDVALEDEVEVLDAALAAAARTASRARPTTALRCANCSRRSRSPRVCASSRARRSFSTTRAVSPAGGGLSKPRISTGVAGRRLAELLAAEVVQRAHAGPGVAGDDRVADLQRAALDEHRRDRAAAQVEARLDDRPGRLRARVRLELLELDVGDEQDLLEQLVEADARLRRDLRDLRRPAPLLGLEPLGRELAAARGRGSRRARSTLLIATTIGTSAARAWEIDSFVCGMTPSSAATTSTAMSVTFAPRARMAVNASWPGVSRNVIRRPLCSTW